MDQKDPEKSQNNDSSPKPSSEGLATEDVIVPLHLLQVTTHINSTQDTRRSLSWQPQPQPSIRSITGNKVGSHRVRGNRNSSILNNGAIESDQRWKSRHSKSLSKNPALGDGNLTRTETATSPFADGAYGSELKSQRQLSYVSGSDDVLSTVPNASGPSTRDVSTTSFWSTTDPFSTRNNSIISDPAQDHLQNCSGTTLGSQTADLEAADGSHEPPVRRGTLRSVVDAIVPDNIQRRFTNASYARRSSMWQTYEKAKERGKVLQRNKYLQWAFEYAIYALLVLFVYFVLVGVPLWNGAVWWLWWVVANKFIIAGGFSITLGIALL